MHNEHNIGDLYIYFMTEVGFFKHLEILQAIHFLVANLKDTLVYNVLRCVKLVLKVHLSRNKQNKLH